MGQSSSSLGSKSGRTRRSFRSFTRRSKLNKSSLSHTFSMPPSDEYLELMNVNTATEEQLMTLPGVGRQLAKDIVRHRQMIGRFKRVDDLALVSGIGAEKLEQLRPEICTSQRRDLSRASSCTQSLESMRLPQENKPCSVNSASVFQLQLVPGLNQELAANIVDYRNRKGPFKSLEGIIKVRGIDIVRLSAIKHHLSLEPRKSESVQLLNGHVTNGWSTDQSLNESLLSGTSQPRSPPRKTLSIPNKFPTITLPNGFANAPVNDIVDLLSAYSHRPTLEEDFRYERNGVKCCRFGSWNLHQLCIDKISNPGVREVVCRTILENKLCLIAVQDVVDEVSLKIICDELNSPVLKRVRQWKCNSQRWNYCLSDTERRLGFIYDSYNKHVTIEYVNLDETMVEDITDSKTQLIEEFSNLQSGTQICIQPQAFLVCDKPLLVVNVLCEKQLNVEVASRLQSLFSLAKSMDIQMCMLGDFYNLKNINELSSTSRWLLDEAKPTTMDPTVVGKSNILTLKPSEKTDFNGTAGIIKSGLSHLAIPRGWSWGGPASPHYPIWAEYNLPG